ncbi:MAG: hypothetical protein JKY53_00130 [Flavobacteriales bacterium]|nr:hypothetical protein [Flavobacteriales bacterium]
MLNTLAKKYEINQSEVDWEIKLFNKLCLIMDAEEQVEKEQKYCEEKIEEKNNQLHEKLIIESFLLKLITNKANSSIFRERIKRIMRKEGLLLDMRANNPSIDVKHHPSYQPIRRRNP